MLVVQGLLLSIGIGTFGYLKRFINQYVYSFETSYSEEENLIKIESQKTCECTIDEFGIRFWPPVYVQRYMAVQEILENSIWNSSIKNVVDFGCAECDLFKYLKSICGLNNIKLVDIDFNTLDRNQSKVIPLNYDYMSACGRREPLTVDIYNGSIAELDDRMLGIDAVICIELIEHLYQDVLDAVPYTVFKFIKPKLAIFTTPNVEFNVLFPNFNTEFRHDDHKFEWTRKEFKEWASKIATRYPEYSVQLNGIGAGPTGTENLGCCSQMAVFYRKDMITSPVEPIGSTPYKLLRRINYPYDKIDENTIRKQTVYDILTKFVSEASFNKDYLVGDNIEIPLSKILPHVSNCCSSVDELEHFVSKAYCTKKNEAGEWLLINYTSDASSEENKSDSHSFSNHSGQEYSLLEDLSNKHNYEEEDWNESENKSIHIGFGESKLCFSTPMIKTQQSNVCLNNIDNSITEFSSSDLYKTATEFSKSEYMDKDDIEISSSFNSSIIIDECKVYNDFVRGRNSSTFYDENVANDNLINDNTVTQNFSEISICETESDDMEISSSFTSNNIIDDCKNVEDYFKGRNNSTIHEDISKIESSLMLVSTSQELLNINDKANDNTIIQNTSDISLKNNPGSSNVHKLKSINCNDLLNISNNDEDNKIDNQSSVSMNKTLLDESGTIKMLCTLDKEL